VIWVDVALSSCLYKPCLGVIRISCASTAGRSRGPGRLRNEGGEAIYLFDGQIIIRVVMIQVVMVVAVLLVAVVALLLGLERLSGDDGRGADLLHHVAGEPAAVLVDDFHRVERRLAHLSVGRQAGRWRHIACSFQESYR